MLNQLAWRNIWRVPRRTVIVLMAVIIGVWAMVVLGAFMAGTIDQMVQNGIETLTGHIQIHKKGYFNDPSIVYTIDEPRKVYEELAKLPSEVRWSRRVRVPAVVSNARNSSGATLVGIVPREEDGVSFIETAVTQGSYLKDEEPHSVLIGRKLAERMGTRLGNKLVLMSQDTNGEIASGGFRITGIFQAEMESTEEQFVFILLTSAQKMLNMGESISEISVLAPRMDMVSSLQELLGSRLGNDYEVLNWKELLPLITTTLEIWDNFNYIWYLVIFIAMAFGLVNTMLIAVFERFREFGMLKAVGMKPRWIIMQIMLEAFWLLMVGTVVGDLLGFGTVTWLSRIGIDLTAFAQGVEKSGLPKIIFPILDVRDMVLSNVLVLVLGLTVNLYPALKAGHITPVKALART